MNKITRSLCLLLVGGMFAVGCEEDPSSVGSSDPSFGAKPGGGGGGSTTPADPELAYTKQVFSKGKQIYNLFVMNIDGTNLTSIYKVPSASMTFGGSPTWSPDGGSIAFTQAGDGSTIPDTIKAIDVSVNSSGVVVGSNLRTVVGLSTTSIRFKNPFWSATSGTDLIAYTTDDGTTNSLYTVPASGGSPTLRTSVDKTWAGHTNPLGVPTWNGDDSKLAMIRIGSGNTTIMIFNASTWAYIDSIVVSGSIFGMEWSRAGSTNALAYSTNSKISYVEPVTGAVPSTNDAVGQYPSWAPDNSSLMVVSGGSLYNNTAYSASTSLVTTSVGPVVRWK